jgi:hypothetical protein
MKRFYDYLLTSQLLRRARFLLPSLCLMALFSVSGTASSVFTAAADRETEKVSPGGQPVASATPTTAEVCQETQNVLDQIKRELKELERTKKFKDEERSHRDSFSALDKAIVNGRLLNTSELEFILADVPVERPKNSNGREKSAVQWTPQERSALQRSLRSALQRELEKAANTTLDRLWDRIAKNQVQRNIREQRMKDLDCVNVLKRKKGETVESRETPDISGTWKYGSYVYTISQKGSTFTWDMNYLNETAKDGTIKGKSLSANVTNTNGSKPVTGEVTQVDGSGRATRIEWSTGAVFTR